MKYKYKTINSEMGFNENKNMYSIVLNIDKYRACLIVFFHVLFFFFLKKKDYKTTHIIIDLPGTCSYV